MGFMNLTYAQLENLPVSSRNSSSEPKLLTIESLDACRAEDYRRAEGFHAFATMYEVWDDESVKFSPYWTHKLLGKWASGEGDEPAVASATYLRNRRLALLTAILDLIQSTDDQRIGLVSIKCVDWTRALIIHARWRFNEIRECIVSWLSPVSEVQGFLFLYMLPMFNPRKGYFEIVCRGVCGGEKLVRLQRRQELCRGARSPEVFVHDRARLMNQITNVIPNPVLYGNQTDSIPAEIANGMYLLQMSVCSIADLCMFDGLCLHKGRFVVVDS